MWAQELASVHNRIDHVENFLQSAFAPSRDDRLQVAQRIEEIHRKIVLRRQDWAQVLSGVLGHEVPLRDAQLLFHPDKSSLLKLDEEGTRKGQEIFLKLREEVSQTGADFAADFVEEARRAAVEKLQKDVQNLKSRLQAFKGTLQPGQRAYVLIVEGADHEKQTFGMLGIVENVEAPIVQPTTGLPPDFKPFTYNATKRTPYSILNALRLHYEIEATVSFRIRSAESPSEFARLMEDIYTNGFTDSITYGGFSFPSVPMPWKVDDTITRQIERSRRCEIKAKALVGTQEDEARLVRELKQYFEGAGLQSDQGNVRLFDVAIQLSNASEFSEGILGLLCLENHGGIVRKTTEIRSKTKLLVLGVYKLKTNPYVENLADVFDSV